MEFLNVIGLLSDPAARGNDPDDAFDLVVPSLPGYGFSGPARERGYDMARIASAFDNLMRHFGYGSYVVQGDNWGR